MYNINYLKSKGFFCDSNIIKIKDNNDFEYFYDPGFSIVYFHNYSKQEIVRIVKQLAIEKNYEIYWFWNEFEKRLFVFRTWGENKIFIFNVKKSKRPDYVKSKKEKLKKFNTKNLGILFDIKDVINIFYKNLWAIRVNIAQSILSSISFQEKILYSQRLIDRLIFCYFLVEKGIIYVINPKGKRVSIDTRRMFESLLDGGENFKDFLDKLFFNYLNSQERNQLSFSKTSEYTMYIPFLNGGLFREKKLSSLDGKLIPESKIKVNNFNWKELISELNMYNWLIEDISFKEEDVLGETIGNLTPEILGYLYEKFVITFVEMENISSDELNITNKGHMRVGNKKIGAYYTPDSITSYISEKCVLDCLKAKNPDLLEFSDINSFVSALRKKELNGLIKIVNILDNLRILDPAVGSGAFLLRVADVLLTIYKIIFSLTNRKIDDYLIKKNIILNNLYGVDIIEGATEICKLRLWLWLVASADSNKSIEPLPNIEYNITTGNSLLGFIIPSLSTIQKSIDSFVGEKPKKYADIIEEKIHILKKYKREKKKYNIKDLKSQIEQINRLGKQIDAKYILELIRNLSKLTVLKRENIKKKLNSDWIKFVHWGFWFPEVFPLRSDSKNVGFDIIIGNPPYINVKKIDKTLRLFYQNIYPSYNANGDVLNLFFERSIDLLKSDGVLSFIAARYWMEGVGSGVLRKVIQKTTEIQEIIDFRSFRKIFVYGASNLGIDTSILRVIKRDKIQSHEFSVYHYNSEDRFDVIKKSNFDSFLINQNNMSLQKWSFTRDDIIEKIEKNTNYRLGDDKKYGQFSGICFIGKGCSTGNNSIFTLKRDVNTLNFIGHQNIKVKLSKDEINGLRYLIKNKDVRRYCHKFTENFWIFLKNKDLKTYPNIVKYLENFRFKLEETKEKYNLENYYDYAAYRSLGWINSNPKIVVPYQAEHNRFALVFSTKPSIYEADIITVVIKPEFKQQIDYYFLLGLLNSFVLDYYMEKTSKKVYNLRDFRSNQIAPLPIKIPSNQHIISSMVYTIVENLENDRNNSRKIDEFLNYLVFELYFEDILSSNLNEQVHEEIKNLITYTDNYVIITNEVVEQLLANPKLKTEIEKIKNHEFYSKIMKNLNQKIHL